MPACEKTGSCHCLLCALSTFQNHITLPTAQERAHQRLLDQYVQAAITNNLMYLYYNGCYSTDMDIFTHLCTLFDSAPKSDYDLAVTLSSAWTRMWTNEVHSRRLPRTTHLLCIQHLKVNAIDYVRNKCGVPTRWHSDSRLR